MYQYCTGYDYETRAKMLRRRCDSKMLEEYYWYPAGAFVDTGSNVHVIRTGNTVAHRYCAILVSGPGS